VTQPDSVSAQPVALIDLYPTLCDLVKVSKPEHLDGTSLKPLLADPSSKRDKPAITCMGGGKNAGYAARDERWRYIRYWDGSEELYDHQNDPNEWTNLAAKPEHAAEKTRLAAFFPPSTRTARSSLMATRNPVTRCISSPPSRLSPSLPTARRPRFQAHLAKRAASISAR
jgi:arylsulfatase A-like enzyme